MRNLPCGHKLVSHGHELNFISPKSTLGLCVLTLWRQRFIMLLFLNAVLMTSWFKFKCRFHVGVIQNKSSAPSKVPTTLSVNYDLKTNFGRYVQDHKS